MILKAIIVDDEPKLLQNLVIKLEKYCPEVKIIAKCQDFHEALKTINENEFDLLFLDIQLPTGTGFELLELVDNKCFEVIFVTGYSKYAIHAIKLSAIDYLLKPVNNKEMVVAVEKVKQRYLEKIQLNNYSDKKTQNKINENLDATICIPSENEYVFVPATKIIRCEGYQRYTKIYLQNKKMLVSSYSIGIYVDKLKDFPFTLVHRSHLVNNQHIISYEKEGVLKMSDGSEVIVSRRKREQFYKEFTGKGQV